MGKDKENENAECGVGKQGMKFRGPVGDAVPNPLIPPKDNDSKAGSSVDRKVRLRGISSLGKTKQETETGSGCTNTCRHDFCC
jgi:hypothetical protein